MDSLDRFCDDLLQDILVFLSFEDKIKYECVSRQWKRCLLTKQTVLVIDGNESCAQNQGSNTLNSLVVRKIEEDVPNRVTVLRKDSFEAVLKKCQTIKKLVINGCQCDDEVLKLIIDNCPLLEDIECELIYRLREDRLLELGQTLGRRLKRFRFVYFTIHFDLMKQFLYSCPKLETINCDVLAAVADQRADFLPKLNNLRVRVRPEDEKNFEILAEKYSKIVDSLKSLIIYGNSLHFPSALKNISRITSLESLTIDISCDTSADRLTTSMLLMAENLKNLKNLTINSMVFISQQFFVSLCHFEVLSKLTVNQNLLHTKCNSNISVSLLSGCKSLKHLTLNGFNISEQFFDDISLYLPQLKSIEFSLMTDSLITNHLFRMFELMEELVKFSFKLTVNKSKKLNNSSMQSLLSQLVIITDNGLSHLINTCPKLRLIELKNIFTPIVGQNTLTSLITKAKNNRKLNFVLTISGDQNILQECEDQENVEQEQIPTNLLINKYFNKDRPLQTTCSSDYFNRLI